LVTSATLEISELVKFGCKMGVWQALRNNAVATYNMALCERLKVWCKKILVKTIVTV